MHETYEIAKLHARINATKESIALWEFHATSRELHSARIEAGALVLLYKSQLRVLKAKLETITSNLALTHA